MARGNEIVVNSEPLGRFEEFFVKTGETFYPGMIVQEDASVALIGGKHTAKIYDRAADGDNPSGAFWVVTNLLQALIGKLCTDSIAAGEKVMCYSPLPGDELNLLIGNLSGTNDDHPLDEILMVDDGTGVLVATTGTPETEVAKLKEVITDPTANTLAWCSWSGH